MGRNRLTVLVGSKNPTKVNAVKEAFFDVFPEQLFSIKGIKVESNVSDQPMTNEETFNGAKNRVVNMESNNGDFYVGIEGGCLKFKNKLFAFAWVIVKNKKSFGYGKTSLFQLPSEIKKLVESGVELGHADDMFFNRENSKQKDGAVGLLTRGLIDRTKYYREATIMALIPFMNKKIDFS